MYKSYHYNDMPQPIHTVRAPEVSTYPESKKTHEEKSKNESGRSILNNLLGDLKTDDIILLVVIFILLIDECDDKLLLIALGFIFFSGIGE